MFVCALGNVHSLADEEKEHMSNIHYFLTHILLHFNN